MGFWKVLNLHYILKPNKVLQERSILTNIESASTQTYDKKPIEKQKPIKKEKKR